MSDLVDRLRDRAYSSKAKDPLCEEAAAEIERLRWQEKVARNIIERMKSLLEKQ